MVSITDAWSVLQTGGWVYIPEGSNGINKIDKSILAVNSGSVLFLSCNIYSNQM